MASFQVKPPIYQYACQLFVCPSFFTIWYLEASKNLGIRFAHFRFSGGKRKNLNGKFPAGKMDRKKGKIGTKKGRKKYLFLPFLVQIFPFFLSLFLASTLTSIFSIKIIHKKCFFDKIENLVHKFINPTEKLCKKMEKLTCN